MKKRLVCLFLAMVMILSVALAGCSKNDSTGADIDTNTGAKTITMRVVTERKVFNTDEELAEYLANVCGGNENDERYIEMKNVKEAYDAVEEAFSKETKSLHKTNVDILFYTEEEYFQLLEETMAEYALEQLQAETAQRALEYYLAEYKATYPDQFTDAAITKSFYNLFPEYKKYENYSGNSGASANDKYEAGDFGIQQLVYPEAEENQLDIVYIQGKEMYNKYIEEGWIIGIDEYLGSTGSLLGDYISTTLLEGVKVDGRTFAIPNNVKMGEYTYMLVDKELADDCRYTYDTFTDIISCKYFLEDVKMSMPNVLPIKSNFKDCMDLYVWYWNLEAEAQELFGYNYTINRENNPSVIGCVYDDPANIGRGEIELGFNNLFANERYREILSTLKSYEYQGMFEQEGDTREGAAISFINNGTYAIKKEAFYNADGTEKNPADSSYGVYTDKTSGKQYYVYVAKYPQAEDGALYGNMFAISANSKYAEACMKVLTSLNTNSKLKNILQHGIEGVDYQINEDTGMLEKLRNYYVMDTERTGNCYISHPDEGLPADFWEDAKKQSNETLIDPLSGFDFAECLADYGAELDVNQIGVWNAYNGEVIAKLDSALTYEAFLVELEGVVTATANEYVNTSGNPLNMGKLTDKNYSTSGGESGEPDNSGESPYTIYYKWLVEMKYLPNAVN